MSGFAPILLCLCVGVGADEPSGLIPRLGSARYVEREAAEGDLVRAGRDALPALRAARQHRDLEIRTRVNALIVKIEGSLLLEATPVALNYRDRPIGEVIRDINRRSGLQLTLMPSQGPFTSRRVTLISDQPVPFWTAIDRLCQGAGLQYSLPGPSAPNTLARAFPLTPGENRPGGPVSDSGPIRVNLMSLHYQRDLSFVTSPGGPIAPVIARQGGPARREQSVNEQFTVRLQVAPEPHLSLRQSGPLRLTSAVDDLGQTLVLNPTAPAGYPGFGYYGAAPGAIQLQAALKRPERPGRSIRVFRGVIPLTISARRAVPLAIPLEGAAGRTFQNEDATVVVHESKPTQNPNQYALEVSITPQAARAAGPDPALDPGVGWQRGDFGPLQIEVTDGSGNLMTSYVSATSQNGDESRLTLVAVAPASGGPPAHFRYFGTIRTSLDVPFEFRDVPMP